LKENAAWVDRVFLAKIKTKGQKKTHKILKQYFSFYLLLLLILLLLSYYYYLEKEKTIPKKKTYLFLFFICLFVIIFFIMPDEIGCWQRQIRFSLLFLFFFFFFSIVELNLKNLPSIKNIFFYFILFFIFDYIFIYLLATFVGILLFFHLIINYKKGLPITIKNSRYGLLSKKTRLSSGVLSLILPNHCLYLKTLMLFAFRLHITIHFFLSFFGKQKVFQVSTWHSTNFYFCCLAMPF